MINNVTNKIYRVAAYGSLISHKSIRQTIPDRHFTPVIVKGYKRVFNLNLFKDNCHDVLNIVKSKNSQFNGVLFKVNKPELLTLKEREIEYNLEEVWAYDFLTHKKLCKCFIFVDPFLSLDKSNHTPHKSYFILCREAAYHISKEFGNYWDRNTFTSNNKPITHFLKTKKSYNTIKTYYRKN